MGGVVSSTLTILETAVGGQEIKTETTENGVKTITTQRKNPYVSVALSIGATTILLIYLDGGTGTLSRIFGRVCVKCQKEFVY